MARRRQFGSIRQVQPSGRYQASYVGPYGRRRNAPTTFKRKTDAARWLAAKEIDIARGTWLDHDQARESFGNYARGWLRDHQNMGPRYRETCLRNLRLHLAPLNEVRLGTLSPYVVRTWYAEARRGTGGRTSIAQSYRFMRAVMNTAVREGIVAKNSIRNSDLEPTGPAARLGSVIDTERVPPADRQPAFWDTHVTGTSADMAR